ncbi:16S rRNA (guanine(1207)-N(2))-methyltransferase RsmC [Xenorhabdus szentirmaii]|uniref:Ribosomal RNA small subunit methyltransferase C n=2 Tax=Xenorhabdus szentirmaii TaxID=290112 RepID=W1ISH9_9GAMM|nr:MULTISPECIES: 16S rRNA (guanine(1207)-N(2))-methyltransferase RsmC [Xenorhabdus]MBD2781587.1 16S rRNA (guanine(1207)-N(2))-methyltransferase RsmC [Xenorhabdus sp. 38]MBD2791640.1 16S rRNA (guanine(1207)-N(2))-methyltransferase RsmC [Xenorhabdus sp. CUL]MBD2802160.1 16S rRNA (guanine(1207)-N(2))-methyltransferase RsmC [Xenorhabdus sp. M]MBD2804747.1 16S rRNA (guanine(1207)-N(2))-methyltransferase RsmC [Xenorhabdus sp. ZM]MBD2821214.1 16S rRNA (guanine(1207)-N(2))-methyltransferase RsmC [Xeno
MSVLTPASEVILRHQDHFRSHNLLFAGDLQDNLATEIEAANVKVHTNQYHHWQSLIRQLGDNAQFGLKANSAFIAGCNTLIFYWPKSKQEARFQLRSLFSILPAGTDIFVVGENRSGVRSVDKLMEGIVTFHKIDTARRCSLFYGQLKNQVQFDQNNWWNSYQVGDVTVNTLPGVFSQDDLDIGSRLLLSTFDAPLSGNLLDLACGSGVLAAVLGKKNPELTLTLSDVNAAAITSSKATLKANKLEGKVIASNAYSAIEEKFDWIISNPPFHDGLKTNLAAADDMIRMAPNYLKPGGKLRIVANAFLPYPDLLDHTFGKHEVIAQTGKFKVYQATKN